MGAAGGIGQPLALLMKMNPLVSVLHLYDVVNSPGVTADVSHMDTGAVVISFFITVAIIFFLTLEFEYQLQILVDCCANAEASSNRLFSLALYMGILFKWIFILRIWELF